MQSLISLLRLGVDGLLLDPQAYRAQRDAPDGLRRGLLLVLLVGALAGAAGLIGNLIESLAQPSPRTIVETVYAGMRGLPWYAEQAAADPAFERDFEASFENTVLNVSLVNGGGVSGGLTQLVLSPLFALIGWLIGGLVAHAVARALGGAASLSQTLSATALASGVGLLGLVQVVPFAQVAATTLLGLIATYVAIREAHGLSPWRSFWATLAGPLLLLLLGLLLACVLFFLISSVVGALSGA